MYKHERFPLSVLVEATVPLPWVHIGTGPERRGLWP